MDPKKIKQLCRQYENKELKCNDFMDALEKEGVPCSIAFVIGDLHHKVSYLTNLSKLDEEDQLIAAKWESERDERGRFFSEVADASDAGDLKKASELLQNLPRTPMECEHGRHIVKTCMACEHIEKTLFPDMFEVEEDEDD